MTDAAIPVTQSAVEAFTRQYLTTVGCTIATEGDTWTVTAPDSAETGLVTGAVTLHRGAPEKASEPVHEDGELLHPESAFFQELLAEASERAPVGVLTLDGDQTDVIVPDWLTESDVTVTGTEFRPYYDRTAVVVIFHVRIETVSEYQQELLRAVAVDGRSGEVLSTLADTVLDYVEAGPSELTPPSELDRPDAERMADLVDAARSTLMETVEPTLDEIQQRASRAARRELEDYRRMKQQRERELRTETQQLQNRIEDVSDRIDDATQDERIQLLKERSELSEELEAAKAGLSDLKRRRRQGFPDRQREIRDRHCLNVTVTPKTTTYVVYERGEIEFQLEDGAEQITLGYGVGEGPTEEIDCKLCGYPLSADRPLGEPGQKRCVDCR